MIVTRFAPSPTGYLHLGHAFAAITAHDTARRNGGRFLLRIEDIDAGRCQPEFERAICDDLTWLGLQWDEPVVRQSDRFDEYRATLSWLHSQGLLYPCFCTRSEIATEIARSTEAPHGPEGPLYPGTCRSLSEAERNARMEMGESHAMRLDVRRAAEKTGALHLEECGAGPHGEHGTLRVNPLVFGDVALARKDTPASYHLAVVLDDAYQRVSLVTRANDLFAATHVQRLLQALVGLPAPDYAHHRLILDSHGRKLSKRKHAVTLRAMRKDGIAPHQIRQQLGLSK